MPLVPITGMVFVIIFFVLKLETPKTPILDGLKAIDWLGSITIVGSTVMFLLGLDFGGILHPWSSAIVVCLIIFGFVTAGLFVLVEWKIALYPLIPLRLFGSISNVASLLACFIHGMTFICGAYFLPLYFQSVLGASALLSGVWLMPLVLSLSFASATTGIYIKKTGRYLDPIIFGFLIATLGFGLFIDLPKTRTWSKIIIFQLVAGLGVGPNFQAPLLALQNGVARRDIATATATFGFVRNLATSIGVVIGGVIFQNGIQRQEETLRARLGNSANLLLGGKAGANVFLIDRLPVALRLIAREVLSIALRDIWILAVSLSAVGCFVCIFIRKTTMSREHQAVKTGLEAEEQHRKTVQEERIALKTKNGGEKV